MKKITLIVLGLFAAQYSFAQWEDDVRLTNDPSVSETAFSPGAHAIASSGDTVHVVWADDRDGNFEVYYKRSIDGGLTWGDDMRITEDPALSDLPSIAVYGSFVHIAWIDTRDSDLELYYKRSTDGGSNWEQDKRILNNPGNAFHPAIALSGDFVHLVWYEHYLTSTWEIMYARSSDNGLSWEEAFPLTSDPSDSFHPSICATGQALHVAWTDNRDDNREIYYKRSMDNGLTWVPDKRLTNNGGLSTKPCIGVSESNVTIVWQDDSNGYNEIYYIASTNGGIEWGSEIQLTDDFVESLSPNLAVSGPGLFLVWVDNRDWNHEIYYRNSSDGGLSWSADKRLTDDPAESVYAFLSISGSVVHVVWTEDRDDNYEIYYKRNPTGNMVVGENDDLVIDSGGLFSIFPNPASERIQINFNTIPSNGILFSIRNMQGELVLRRLIQNGEINIDVSGLKNGVYCVGFSSNDNPLQYSKLFVSK
ncbi:MAG: exo-alpha-sialidase [Bacteroidales bacterium]|nr:exo-alpha-sialidase [Bacteroidales bacterium]